MSLYHAIHLFRMRRQLHAYHSGDLSSEARRRIERHAGTCRACAVELRTLQSIDQLLRHARPVAIRIPEERSQEIYARALADSGVLTRRNRSVWPLLAGGTALAAVCLFAGLGPGSHGPERDRQSSPSMPQRLAANPRRVTGDASDSSRSRPQPPPSASTVEPSPIPSALWEKRLRQPRRKNEPARRVRLAGSLALRTRTARCVRTATPDPATKRPLERVTLESGSKLDWRPEATSGNAAGVTLALSAPLSGSEVPLLEEQEVRSRMAQGIPSEPVLSVAVENPVEVPAIKVAVRKADDEIPGMARASAFWSQPAGPTLWKQALITSERPMAELLLVSLDEERLWGFWKEKLE